MNALSIELLMVVVVQDQDLELGTRALNVLNLPFVYLASVGGFLGMRNGTLLLGLRERQVREALRALEESCHQRTEYLVLPLGGPPHAMPMPVPVTVGGATVFTVPAERFEEI